MNNQTISEQTIVRQATELTQAKAKISGLEEAHEALRQLAKDNQEEIEKLRSEAELLNALRTAFRKSFRHIPIPQPLRGRLGVVQVSYGDFEISVSGIACVVKYELDGSSYAVDFKLVPIPSSDKDFYPGYNFDVWAAPKRRRSKPRVKNT